MSGLPVIKPNLQVSFYFKLKEISDRHLRTALADAVGRADIHVLDAELSQLVDAHALNRVASFGLRGEVVFAVPTILRIDPFLLAYYRLLLGFSQKEFYSGKTFGRYIRLEERGHLGTIKGEGLSDLCRSLAASASYLLNGVDDLTADMIRDLQVLTVGAQLRGSENNRIGRDSTQQIYSLFENIFDAYIRDKTKRTIIIENDSRRKVMIKFASDPDVQITQSLENGTRPILSIEVKGGTDASNVHNRLGEAEKSHQKAKDQGCFEFWTILRADVQLDVARRETPTTSRFFSLGQIADPHSPQHREFRELLASLVGVRVSN